MKKEIKLSNCPCCNGEPVLTEGLVYSMIKCPKCGLNIFDKREFADRIAKKWNKRVTEP